MNDESVNQLHLDDNTAISAPGEFNYTLAFKYNLIVNFCVLQGLESGLRMLYTLEQQESIETPVSGSNQSSYKADNTSPTPITPRRKEIKKH